jgi:phenylacetate-coenzyme A ligase PaaK-like adenylate-forming protein
VSIRQRLVRDIVFPATEFVRGRPTAAWLRNANASQWWSLDALVDFQTTELRRLLAHCWAHNPFYRRRLEAAGLHPDDVRSPADLVRLPLLTKREIRTARDEIKSKAPPYAAVRKATSGSTEEAFAFEYNAESRYWRDVTRLRAYEWAGYPVGARAVHYWGRGVVPATRVKQWKAAADHALKREVYIDCTPRGDADLERVVARIRELRPDVLVAFTQAAGDLARFVLRNRLRRDWGSISVICGAERVFEADRAALSEAFGPVFETYGGRETMLIASECEAHDGLHVAMENIIAEIVVRNRDGTVRPANPGESGEVAVTDLHNYFMPFVRYLNGDRAVQRNDEPCSCGRGLRRIGQIEGRVVERLVDAHGNQVDGLVFELMFREIIDFARQIQVVQSTDRAVTVKLVMVEPGAVLPAAKEAIVRSVFARYMPGLPATIETVEHIPLTAAGKRRLVISGVEPVTD